MRGVTLALIKSVTRNGLWAAIIASAILAGSPVDSWPAQVTLKLGHNQNAGTPHDTAARKFAARVAEVTSGAVEVKIYGAMSLGNERQMLEQVQLGNIEMGIFSNDYLSNIVPEMGVTTLPYIIRDLDHIHKVWQAPVGKEMTDLLLKKSLRSLGTYDFGFRITLTQGRAVANVGDFKSVKIRVMESPTVIKTWKLLGANPIPMPWSEVYSAMQTKVIDAMEADAVSIWSTKLQEIGKFLALTRHQYTGSHVIMGEAAFQRLAPAHRDALLKVGAENAVYQQQLAFELQRDALDKLRAFGVKVNDVNLAELQKVVAPVYDDFTKSVGGADWVKRVIAVK